MLHQYIRNCLHYYNFVPYADRHIMIISYHMQINTLWPRAHQTRRSGRNSLPISAEVALPRLQSEINVALFLFASHSFLANNLRFMVKLIVKTIVINGKIHKNKRKRFHSSNKEGLICWYKSITANFCKFVLTKFQVNNKSQILKYTNRRFLYQLAVELCYILIIFTKLELFVAF